MGRAAGGWAEAHGGGPGETHGGVIITCLQDCRNSFTVILSGDNRVKIIDSPYHSAEIGNYDCFYNADHVYEICSAGALGGGGGNEARGAGWESEVGLPSAEARAHRSEEEWLKAWEDRSSSGILGEIEVVVKDGRKGVRVRKRVC